MWNAASAFNAVNALAEKAKKAATELENRLDKSVGMAEGAAGGSATASTQDDSDANAWKDDDFQMDDLAIGDSFDVDDNNDDGAVNATETNNKSSTETPPNDPSTQPVFVESKDNGSDFGLVKASEATAEVETAAEGNVVVGDDADETLQKSDAASSEQEQQTPLQNNSPTDPTKSTDEGIAPPTKEQPVETEAEADTVAATEEAQNPETPEYEPPAAEQPATESVPAEPQQPPVVAGEQEEGHDVDNDATNQQLRQLQAQVRQLQGQLQQREEQLVSKTEQITSMQALMESERQELEKKVQETKEEAKRRVLKARERVEAAEKRATAASSSSNQSNAQQEEIIAALREEGEKLARKQADMEKAVRTAKAEARDLREQVQDEQSAKTTALDKIAKLETDLKATQTDLTAARKGESAASKLSSELQAAREEAERKASTILTLEQQVKELKSSARDLQKELEAARKGAALDSERSEKKMKQQHMQAVEDLEGKLRTAEREAAVREDALRQEVSELRLRWQDAVRRADALSLDVQSSTAPLLRQLESLERQNRTRATNWAALETKLRQDLEEAVIQTERWQKERNEMASKCQRLERHFSELQSEHESVQTAYNQSSDEAKALNTQLTELKAAHAAKQLEWDEVERLAQEGVAKVRSEMTQTVVESEERHVSQLDAMSQELAQERDKRQQLEQQVQQLLDKTMENYNNAAVNGDEETSAAAILSTPLPTKAPPKKLGSGQGQAEILFGALNGLGGDDDDEDEQDSPENDGWGDGDNDGDLSASALANGAATGSSSFAALEELQSRLRVAKVELNTLRKSLAESETSRKTLVAELAESRHAKERLPAVERKLSELTEENQHLTLEIQGLQEDIAEVRELYRGQLNVLLEEKATQSASEINVDGGGQEGSSNNDSSGPSALTTQPSRKDLEEMRQAKKD